MDNSEFSLEKLTDGLGDIISGVPAPVRKNFFKACAQLCTAAVDVPVAWLEGKSAEIRATYEARIQIIKKEGNNIAEEIQVPKEYISRASEKFASKIIKEQLNLDEITRNAASNLADEEHKKTSSSTNAEIGDDWLSEFENLARLKSSEDMKIIFGKILSGEISSPGTFSIRTVRLISQLDNEAAKLFQLLCSMTVTMDVGYPVDARVVSLSGSAANNSLAKFGLSFDKLNILQEYGLIISDYNSWMRYGPCIAHNGNQVSAILRFKNRKYGFIPTDKERYDKELKLDGIALTKAGKELLTIIPLIEVPQYKSELESFFISKYLQMIEIKD
jgi:hypothetical protein